MAFTIYSSFDASAPVLTGLAGTLVGVLDAVLVNGYGSKAAAGWTKAFSGTNKAAYLQGSGSSAHYLRVDDTAATGISEVRLYKPMTDVDTGTALSVASYVMKSSSANSTARDWLIFADAKTFYMFIVTGSSGSFRCSWMFGDIVSFATSTDNERAMLIARGSAATSLNSQEWLAMFSRVGTTITGHAMAGALGAPGLGIAAGKHADGAKCASQTSSLGVVPSPNSVDSAYYISPIFVSGPTEYVRGRLRGCWAMSHPVSGFSEAQSISGANELVGYTFQVVRSLTANNTTGYSERMVLIETSNTLDS